MGSTRVIGRSLWPFLFAYLLFGFHLLPFLSSRSDCCPKRRSTLYLYMWVCAHKSSSFQLLACTRSCGFVHCYRSSCTVSNQTAFNCRSSAVAVPLQSVSFWNEFCIALVTGMLWSHCCQFSNALLVQEAVSSGICLIKFTPIWDCIMYAIRTHAKHHSSTKMFSTSVLSHSVNWKSFPKCSIYCSLPMQKRNLREQSRWFDAEVRF